MTASDFDLFTTILLPSSKFCVFGRHKALLLCKSPCEGAASVGGRLPCSTEAPAKRNFQRKFVLRRFKTKSLLLGSKIVRKRSKPVLPEIKNESAHDTHGHSRLILHRKPRPPRDSKRAAALLSHARQRSPKKQLLRGGSTPRFFAQLRSVGSKKGQGCGKHTAFQIQNAPL